MKTIKYLILTFYLIGCQTLTEQKFNLGFEKNLNNTSLSDGWFKWGKYELSIDSLSYTGNKSAKITSTDSDNFGSIAYLIPAKYSGKSIKLEGYMKTRNVINGHAGLLLRVDGNEKTLVFDNMKEQNVYGTKDWGKYSIKLNYPEDAKNIYVAGILTGKGEAWFDDFKLTIDGKNVQTLEETAKSIFQADLDKEFDNGSNITLPKLTPNLINDLELLGKVWGFLKYYHPEIAKGNYNWDYELFRFISRFLKESDDNNKENMLLKWIDNLGELDECIDCKETAVNAHLKPDLDWIGNNIQSELLKNKLNYIYNNRNQGKHYYIKMADDVGNPVFINEKAYSMMSYPDVGFRILALYRYWNMINYFFPYKHLIDKDWSNTLREYIPLFINTKNELEYELTTIQIIGDVKDTHANLWGGNNKINKWKGNYFAPFHLRFIEDKLVVTDYYNPELKQDVGLIIGDIITRIDNQSITDIINNLTKYFPASNKPTRLRDISADILRSQKSELEIEYIQNGVLKTKLLKLHTKDSLNIYRWYKRDNEKSYRLLDNNIGYITLKTIVDNDIAKIKKVFRSTKGIIIDIRNYPSTFVPFKLGSFFVSTATPFVKFTTGNIKNPGEFTFNNELKIPQSAEFYSGKVIVIVNELTQSQAEYTAMAFKAGANTTIIGSTTAGADGNVSTIMLPGGLRTMISGIGVFYPNGDETQRIGILPDIIVKPSIEGIKNGKDELLEKAIELILINKNQE